MSSEYRVKNGILGLSFDKEPSSSIADEKIIKKAEEDEARGSKCVSHLILRSEEHMTLETDKLEKLTIDNLKSNYLLNGAPLHVYGMRNMLGSNLERIVAVGSKEQEPVYIMARELFEEQGYIGDRQFDFVLEDESKLSLYNTIMRGKEAFNQQERLIYLHLGDLPLHTNINPILMDMDAKDYDVIADFNSRERIFLDAARNFSEREEFFFRNWYRKLKERDGRICSFKEANCYLLNMDKVDEELLNFLTGTRKGGALRKFGVLKMALQRAENIKEGIKVLRSVLGYICTKYIGHLESIAEVMTHAKVRFKALHSDFARLADIDSLEDWRFYEELFAYTERVWGSIRYIYPYAEDIAAFKDSYSEELKKFLPMYRDFHAFINSRFLRYGLLPPYVNGRLEHQIPHARLKKAAEHLHRNLVLSAQAESRRPVA